MGKRANNIKKCEQTICGFADADLTENSWAEIILHCWEPNPAPENRLGEGALRHLESVSPKIRAFLGFRDFSHAQEAQKELTYVLETIVQYNDRTSDAIDIYKSIPL
ncbi:MAG: hypothetical protein AB1478_10455 [Nitrospirota bacterium]